nr:preprotein translocase subunit SecG [Arenimonas sp.]
FLSTATKWLAVVFFAMSLGMAWNATRTIVHVPADEDLGAMSEVPAVVTPAGELPASDVPVIPSANPAAPAPAPAVTAPAAEDAVAPPAAADPAATDADKTQDGKGG